MVISGCKDYQWLSLSSLHCSVVWNVHNFYNQGKITTNYVIIPTQTYAICPCFGRLWQGRASFYSTTWTHTRKVRSDTVARNARLSFLKSAFILCANIFYGSCLLSLDFYLLLRTTAWLGSMTAEMSVCQFSKLPAPVQADRNDGNGSYFKGKLSGKMINGPQSPSASTPPKNHSVLVAGTNPLIGFLPTKMKSRSKLRHKTSSDTMGSH